MIGIFCILQTIISTFKNIFIIRKQMLLSGLFCAAENIVYYIFVSKAIVERNTLTFIVISIFYGIGTFLGLLINKKFTHINETLIITSKNVDDVLELKEKLKNMGIKFILTSSYSTKDEKNLSILAFVKTESQKKEIMNLKKIFIEII